MALFTSIADGNWTTFATWDVGGAYPSDGDVAIIYHNVTLDADITIGVGAGVAITIAQGPVSTGILAILSGCGTRTLTLKGAININTGGQFWIGDGPSGGPLLVTDFVEVIFTTADRYISLSQAGVILIRGTPNYRFPRTRILNDVAAGVPATIDTFDATDWLATDEVWVSSGADKAVAPTLPEKITIAGIASPTQFTANLVNDHQAGDFLVSGMRNVRLRGNSVTEGFYIYVRVTPNANPYVYAAQLKIDWAELQWYGEMTYWSGIYYYVDAASPGDETTILDSKLQISNCLFDSQALSGISALYLNQNIAQDDSADGVFDGNQFWSRLVTDGSTQTCVKINSYDGIFKFDDTTMLGYTSEGFLGGSRKPWLQLDAFWFGGDAKLGNQVNVFIDVNIRELTNFKIHNYLGGWRNINAPNYFISSGGTLINTGYFYHGYGSSYAINFASATSGQIPNSIKIVGTEFYHNEYGFLKLNNAHGNVLVDTCTFDNSNDTGGAAYSPVEIGEVGASSASGMMIFTACEFGLQDRNNKHNIMLSQQGPPAFVTTSQRLRIILDSCKFREPLAYAPGGVAGANSWENTLGWIAQDMWGYLNNWDTRAYWGELLSLEIIDCESQDATGADQWPVTYPGVTRLGVVHGGCEIRKEPSTGTVIDNTFALKVLPFHCRIRNNATRYVPISIPVTSGQTVTVDLSVRKTQSQAAGNRPRIHLQGLGVDIYNEMSDVNNTWEQLEIVGVATSTGVMHFWVSAQNEYAVRLDTVDDYYSPHDLGWQVVYFDGLFISVT